MNNKKPLKILILTTKGGQGLISGANALRDAFFAIDHRSTIEILDFFAAGSFIGNFLTRFYNYLLRKSLFWSSVYIQILHILRPDRWSFLFLRPTFYYRKLLKEKKPDLVVLTSQYIVALVGRELKNRSNCLVYVANIDLGSKFSDLWFDKNIHLHILPTKESLKAYFDLKLPPERAILGRMLIRKQFLDLKLMSKSEARKKLSLDNSFTILLAGSREGYEGIIPIIKELSNIENISIIAMVGNNKYLYDKINNISSVKAKKILPLMWIDNMALYMKAVDVIIAKPGKQTVTEVFFSQTPFIPLIFPKVMEQEIGNIEYLKNRGVYFEAKNSGEIVDIVLKLKDDRVLYAAIQKKMKNFSSDIDPFFVADLILRDAC